MPIPAVTVPITSLHSVLNWLIAAINAGGTPAAYNNLVNNVASPSPSLSGMTVTNVAAAMPVQVPGQTYLPADTNPAPEAVPAAEGNPEPQPSSRRGR